jgi:hypothetical protein
LPGDNLGNHIATQTLNLNGNWLSGNGASNGLFVSNLGKIGIGTSTPTVALDVAGPVQTDATSGFMQ